VDTLCLSNSNNAFIKERRKQQTFDVGAQLCGNSTQFGFEPVEHGAPNQ